MTFEYIQMSGVLVIRGYRWTWLGAGLTLFVVVVVVPNLVRQGTYFGISPWLSGGLAVGIFAIILGAVLYFAVRSGRAAKTLFAWSRSSDADAAVHIIEATRGLRRHALEGGNTHPRFWSMAVGLCRIVGGMLLGSSPSEVQAVADSLSTPVLP